MAPELPPIVDTEPEHLAESKLEVDFSLTMAVDRTLGIAVRVEWLVGLGLYCLANQLTVDSSPTNSNLGLFENRLHQLGFAESTKLSLGLSDKYGSLDQYNLIEPIGWNWFLAGCFLTPTLRKIR